MVEQRVTLASATGLHARPAALFVQAVNRFPGTEVRVRKGEREVNGRSLLSILSLGIGQGESITLHCEGAQEAEALAELAHLLEHGLSE